MSGETPGAGAAPLAALGRWWQARAPREQRLLVLAAAAVAVALLWFVALAPALRTLARAPAEIAAAQAQLQTMQRLAAEARELRAAAPVSVEQAGIALQAATARLGDKGRLVLQGDRATLTVRDIGSGALRDWLTEARSGARARPAEATLTRSPGGLSGTVIVALGGGA